jgi:hypothetical protein
MRRMENETMNHLKRLASNETFQMAGLMTSLNVLNVVGDVAEYPGITAKQLAWKNAPYATACVSGIAALIAFPAISLIPLGCGSLAVGVGMRFVREKFDKTKYVSLKVNDDESLFTFRTTQNVETLNSPITVRHPDGIFRISRVTDFNPETDKLDGDYLNKK